MSTEKRVFTFYFHLPLPRPAPILGRPFLPGLKSFVLPPLAHLVGPKSPWGTPRTCSASTSPSQPFWPVHCQCGPSVRSRWSQHGHLRSPSRGLEIDVFSKSNPERGLNWEPLYFSPVTLGGKRLTRHCLVFQEGQMLHTRNQEDGEGHVESAQPLPPCSL